MENNWIKIKGYKDYEISRLGLVRSLKFGTRIMKDSSNGKGYPTVILSENNVQKRFTIHRLVATHFVSGFKKGLEVNHKNGIKQDCFAENLEWVTHSENSVHSCENGLFILSEKHKSSLINANKGGRHYLARKVKDTISGKVFDTIADAANENGIKECTLRDWLNGRYTNKSNLILLK